MKEVLRAIFGGLGSLGLLIFLSPAAATAASNSSKEWVKLENCKLVSNESNDGDSFHIRSGDTEYLIRLYLVDAPEIENVGAGRLVEQASYFGVTVPEVIEIGRRAKQLVDEKMAEPFTVFTRMAGGLGRSKVQRFLGFVEVKDGDLGELLVLNGLARIHGTRGAPPGVATSAEELTRLQELERKAKEAKRGGWDMSSLAKQKFEAVPPLPAMAKAAKTEPSKKSERSTVPLASAAPGDSSKLDINEAAEEELERLPGIGHAMSARIIAARPFKSADDLRNVKGIGSGKRYEELRSYFQ